MRYVDPTGEFVIPLAIPVLPAIGTVIAKGVALAGAVTQAAQRIGFSAGSNSPEGKAVIEYRSKRLQMLLTRW